MTDSAGDAAPYNDPRDPRLDDPARRPGGDDRGGSGRGWMLAFTGLVALVVGLGAGLLIDSGGGDTKTVHTGVKTVTSTVNTTNLGVTVRQPTTTVTQTVTAPPETVTVTVPGESATQTTG
ncbi:hypothetical protein [Conexibacter woesei]|uniref:hypothetical protein n=1 Tax=Conexibacter woesei TaxID=191495 RepID=UPI0004091653|nr:hypothetical protein [Conexibacter woesei]